MKIIGAKAFSTQGNILATFITVMSCASMFGDEQTICDRVLVCRSSILTAKNTELKSGSKVELSVEVEIVP